VTRGQAEAPSSPIEIVSIDEIVLRRVEVTGGGRTLRGDNELAPRRDSLLIRRVSLTADDTTIAMTGTLASLSPMRGGVDVSAQSLDIDRLAAFVRDFVATPLSTPAPEAGGAAAGTAAAPPASPIGQLTLALKAGRVTAGGLTLSGFSATGIVSPDAIAFEPLTFGVFGGRYEGAMRLGLGAVPQVDWSGAVTAVDTARLMAFAGSPDTITGSLNGDVRLRGQAAQIEQALRSATGRARVDITGGSIAGLQLVRTLVTATSGRGGIAASVSSAAAASRDQTGAERFSRLGATLRLEGGVIATDDIAMRSPDVDLTASGTLRVTDLSADLSGRAQLSEALSKQAGVDLVRYTQENGRVTLPVTVSGPLADLTVRVNLGDAAARAIRNKATEELNKAIQRGLGGLLKPPR
jgi:AsmA protein